MKLIIPLLFLILLAYERNSVWRDEMRLWRDAAPKSPHKERVHLNLGTAYASEEMNNLAIAELRKAVSLDPSDDVAHLNLGVVLGKAGRFEEAAKEFIQALDALQKEDVYPGNKLSYHNAWKIHNNLGNAFREMNMLDDALKQHLLALRLNPRSALVHFNLGKDYESKGDFLKAIEEFLKALSLDPNLKEARQALNDLQR